MKRITLRLIPLVIALLLLSGCTGETNQEFSQTQNEITAEFHMSPASPVAMEPVTFSLNLSDPSGQAIEGAQVSYDLTMPGMMMPPNQPTAAAEGGGLYTSNAIFTMSGAWKVEAIVTYEGGTTIFPFEFSVK
jgi:hypothetical protein